MITIEHLEIRFDVEGDEDEQVFAGYFNRYIEAWSRRRESRQSLVTAMAGNRALGDRAPGEKQG